MVEKCLGSETQQVLGVFTVGSKILNSAQLGALNFPKLDPS